MYLVSRLVIAGEG